MAIGVGDDDQRHFVGFTCVNSESYTSWRGFLQDLEQRGVIMKLAIYKYERAA